MHDHNPLREEIPLMLTEGVTGIIHQLPADIEISGSFRASKEKYEGFTRRALKAIDIACIGIERNRDAILALTTTDIEAAKKDE